jgi:hypothetical protein
MVELIGVLLIVLVVNLPDARIIVNQAASVQRTNVRRVEPVKQIPFIRVKLSVVDRLLGVEASVGGKHGGQSLKHG